MEWNASCDVETLASKLVVGVRHTEERILKAFIRESNHVTGKCVLSELRFGEYQKLVVLWQRTKALRGRFHHMLHYLVVRSISGSFCPCVEVIFIFGLLKAQGPSRPWSPQQWWVNGHEISWWPSQLGHHSRSIHLCCESQADFLSGPRLQDQLKAPEHSPVSSVRK